MARTPSSPFQTARLAFMNSPPEEIIHSANVLWIAAITVFVLSIVWFRILPAQAFGDRRVMVFGIIAQPCIVVLLTLTKGLDSEYFSFGQLLTIATVFAPRTRHTVVVAAATLASLLLVGLLVPPVDQEGLIAEISRRASRIDGQDSMGFTTIAA